MRIFVILFLLGFYVITMGYRGSLISHQLVPTQQKPLETIQEVIDSPYNVYSLGRVVRDQLKYSPDPLMRELDKKYVIHNQRGGAVLHVNRGERVHI